MRCRRPFPMRRPRRPGMRPGGPQELLAHANTLFSQGDYNQAAQIFLRLAVGAEARGIQRAPHLFIRAGQANLLDGNIDLAMEHVWKGLKMFALAERWKELQNTGGRVVNVLREKGYSTEAEKVESWLNETLPASTERISVKNTAGNSKTAHLPVSCPSCGGPVHPDEVKWVDEITAECVYCGSLIRGETD